GLTYVVCVNQRLKGDQAGFTESFVTTLTADEVEARAEWDEAIRRTDSRRPGAHGDLRFGVRQLLHGPPIRGDQRRGCSSKDRPPLEITFGGVYRAGPNGPLILQDELRHPPERMQDPGAFPKVILLDD